MMLPKDIVLTFYPDSGVEEKIEGVDKVLNHLLKEAHEKPHGRIQIQTGKSHSIIRMHTGIGEDSRGTSGLSTKDFLLEELEKDVEETYFVNIMLNVGTGKLSSLFADEDACNKLLKKLIEKEFKTAATIVAYLGNNISHENKNRLKAKFIDEELKKQSESKIFFSKITHKEYALKITKEVMYDQKTPEESKYKKISSKIRKHILGFANPDFIHEHSRVFIDVEELNRITEELTKECMTQVSKDLEAEQKEKEEEVARLAQAAYEKAEEERAIREEKERKKAAIKKRRKVNKKKSKEQKIRNFRAQKDKVENLLQVAEEKIVVLSQSEHERYMEIFSRKRAKLDKILEKCNSSNINKISIKQIDNYIKKLEKLENRINFYINKAAEAAEAASEDLLRAEAARAAQQATEKRESEAAEEAKRIEQKAAEEASKEAEEVERGLKELEQALEEEEKIQELTEKAEEERAVREEKERKKAAIKKRRKVNKKKSKEQKIRNFLAQKDKVENLLQVAEEKIVVLSQSDHKRYMEIFSRKRAELDKILEKCNSSNINKISIKQIDNYIKKLEKLENRINFYINKAAEAAEAASEDLLRAEAARAAQQATEKREAAEAAEAASKTSSEDSLREEAARAAQQATEKREAAEAAEASSEDLLRAEAEADRAAEAAEREKAEADRVAEAAEREKAEADRAAEAAEREKAEETARAAQQAAEAEERGAMGREEQETRKAAEEREKAEADRVAEAAEIEKAEADRAAEAAEREKAEADRAAEAAEREKAEADRATEAAEREKAEADRAAKQATEEREAAEAAEAASKASSEDLLRAEAARAAQQAAEAAEREKAEEAARAAQQAAEAEERGAMGREEQETRKAAEAEDEELEVDVIRENKHAATISGASGDRSSIDKKYEQSEFEKLISRAIKVREKTSNNSYRKDVNLYASKDSFLSLLERRARKLKEQQGLEASARTGLKLKDEIKTVEKDGKHAVSSSGESIMSHTERDQELWIQNNKNKEQISSGLECDVTNQKFTEHNVEFATLDYDDGLNVSLSRNELSEKAILLILETARDSSDFVILEKITEPKSMFYFMLMSKTMGLEVEMDEVSKKAFDKAMSHPENKRLYEGVVKESANIKKGAASKSISAKDKELSYNKIMKIVHDKKYSEVVDTSPPRPSSRA